MDWGAFASSVEGLKSRGADLQKRIRGLRRRLRNTATPSSGRSFP